MISFTNRKQPSGRKATSFKFPKDGWLECRKELREELLHCDAYVRDEMKDRRIAIAIVAGTFVRSLAVSLKNRYGVEDRIEQKMDGSSSFPLKKGTICKIEEFVDPDTVGGMVCSLEG